MLPDARPRTVLVAGGSGFLGTHLVRHLAHRGDAVRRLVRRAPRGPEEVRWDPASGGLPRDALADVDAVVNLGGVGLADRRWTPRYRAEIIASRVQGTDLLARALADEARRRTGLRFLQASAVGYYGDRGEEVLTEDSSSGDDFTAEVCRRWEAATAPAEAAGVPVVHLRTGIVLGPGGGAVGPLLPLLRAGLAGPLAGGRAWWPWISLADQVRAQLHLLDSSLAGPVNLVGPEPARQGDVMRELARAMHRPAVIPVPRLALRVVLGEFADSILASQRLLPRRLLDDGFTFCHPTLRDAAEWVAARA